jgi:hypothetical protein
LPQESLDTSTRRAPAMRDALRLAAELLSAAARGHALAVGSARSIGVLAAVGSVAAGSLAPLVALAFAPLPLLGEWIVERRRIARWVTYLSRVRAEGLGMARLHVMVARLPPAGVPEGIRVSLLRPME